MPLSRPSPAGFALLVALVVAYAFCVPLAAAKPGDFSHLWVGGAALVEAGPGAIYDPTVHKALLEAALGPVGDDLWAARNDRLGAFFYPPVTAMLYAPLGALPYATAAAAHAVAQIGGALAASALLARLLPRLGLAGAAALLLLFPSTFFGYALGQNGLWALLVVAGGGALAVGGRPLWGGLLLGLLAAKPSWWIAVALVAPLGLRSARLGAGMALGAAGMVCAGLLLGLEPTRQFAALAPQLAQLERLSDYPLHLQHDLLGLARRALGLGAGTAAGWAAALGLAAATAWRAPRLAPGRRWGLVAAAATLCNPHVHHYDLLVGLIGVAALAAAAAAPGASRRAQGALLALVVAHHAAFLVEIAFDLDAWISLPAVALLTVWAALAFGPLPGAAVGPRAG